jgi:hypothetical protein
MNNLNNNFLEDDENVEYTDDESAADEIIEEIEEVIEEEAADAENTASVLNEAVKRIEQANLYKALLDHDLFAPGSARPEVIAAVRKEFKGFILVRLEILLGIKPEAPKAQQTIVQSPFSPDEVTALAALAKRMIDKKDTNQPTPQVQVVQPPTPKIQALQTQAAPQVQTIQTQPEPVQPKRVVKRVVRRVVRKANGELVDASEQVAPATPAAKKPRAKRDKTNNTSVFTGEDLGQAQSPERPPMKMPSQAQMDMMNAQQAESNARGASRATQGVGLAINASLK